MKKWNIKYLIFSLILLIGAVLGCDRTYALDWCPSSNPACKSDEIITTIKCNYTINTDKNRTTAKNYSKTFSFYRKLEVDKKLVSSITYSISDYNSNQNSIKSNGGTDYYKSNFECPQSIAYYDNLTLDTQIYYSQSKDGSDKWYDNLTGGLFGIGAKGDELTVYRLESTEKVGNSKIALLKDCDFSDDSNNKLTFYTEFTSYSPGITFSAKSDVSGYSIDNNNNHNLYVGQYKNVSSIYDAMISGDCNSKMLSYAYFYPNYNEDADPAVEAGWKGYIIFNENGDILNNNDSKGFLDYGYKNYLLFKNDKLVTIVQEGIESVSKKVKNCDTQISNKCKSTDDDSQECNKAREICYEANTELNTYCSFTNKNIVNDDYKNLCQIAEKTINNYASQGYSFNVDVSVEVTCETLGGLREKLQTYFNIIKLLVPILIIALGIIDFIKAIASSDDDALKKAGNKFIRRLIIGVVIILLPYLVDIILQLVEDYYPSGTCGIK